jgi:VanZ family protein
VPTSFRSRVLVWSALAGAYWLLIFVLTHVPISVPGAEHSLDKLQHAGAFFGLAVLLGAAYDAWRGLTVAGCGWILLATGLYGAVDELTQALIPYRYPSVFDWLADFVGAALGVVAAFGWVVFWRTRAAASPAAASAEVKTR